MKLNTRAQDLYEEISELRVIDAHEHLPSEEEYLGNGYCGPNMFAGGYVWHDLHSAGLSTEVYEHLRDGGYRPVEDWWPKLRPYWQYVKYTSYSRALRITVGDLFGIQDINDDTIHQLAERVQADNTPGLYERILSDRCGIERAITCVGTVSFPNDPILRGLAPSHTHFGPEKFTPHSLKQWLSSIGGMSDSLHQVAEGMRQTMRLRIAGDPSTPAGVGIKIAVADYDPPDREAAEAELAYGIEHPEEERAFPALRDFLFDVNCDVAAELDVPIAVHTGYWGDFRQLDPKFMLGFALRRADVRFDMFHLGMPMVRDAALIGKTLPNVTLNLCWSPIISQIQTKRTLDEIIDLVPLNKVIAFGADYRVAVHKVYGHLVAAREVVAAALADRIEAGDFDREEALRIARMWFYDNPKRVYRLP